MYGLVSRRVDGLVGFELNYQLAERIGELQTCLLPEVSAPPDAVPILGGHSAESERTSFYPGCRNPQRSQGFLGIT